MFDSEPGMEAVEVVDVLGMEEKTLAQHPEWLLRITGQVLVLGPIPRHVIEGTERRRPGQTGVAGDILRLHDPVLPTANGCCQEMVLGRAGIGLGPADPRAPV